MNRILLGILKRALSCSGVSGGNGQAELRLPLFNLLPKEAAPHLHFVDNAMRLLPGVNSAEVSPSEGLLRVSYEPELWTPAELRQWYDALLSTGLEYAASTDISRMTPDQAAGELSQQMEQRLPGFLASIGRGADGRRLS